MQIYKYCIQNVAQSTARRRPSCRSRSMATTARACIATNRSGKAASRSSPARNMPICRRLPVIHRRHHQARQGDQRLHQPDDQQLQAAGPGLRGAGAARLLGAQPLGLMPHSYTTNPKAKRVEVRFPDPLANPYLGFAAMLMAGIDGIKNKLDPGEPIDKDLYDLPPKELRKFRPCAARCAKRSRSSEGPRLPQGRRRVHDDFLDAYIDLKMAKRSASNTRRIRSSSKCTTRRRLRKA